MLRVEPLESRIVPAARLQLLHNSPYAAVATVDVYLDGVRLVDDLNFRTATPFLDVAPDVNHKVQIVPGNAADNAAPLYTTTVNLPNGQGFISTAVGDPSVATGANAFALITAPAREKSNISTVVDLLPLHGSPDAGSVNVRARGVGLLANNLAYPGYSTGGYVSVAPAKYTVDVTGPSGGVPIGSYTLDAAALAGQAAVVAASGFVSNGFGLLIAFPNGKTQLLPVKQDLLYSAGATANGNGVAILAGPTGTAGLTVTAFPGVTSGARTAAADITGDGVPDLIAATGPGVSPLVRVFDGTTGTQIREIKPFEATFLGGLQVAAGDLNADGTPDIVITPDQGGGPRVMVRSGKTDAVIADFFGIDDPNFRGGARAAVGDLTGDGTPDLIVAAGFGGGPRVAGFDGKSIASNAPVKIFADFFIFEQTLRNGVFVAAGDLDGDGNADLIAGGGPGGGPRVFALSGKPLTNGTNTQTTLANFFAGPDAERGGVRVFATDLDFNGKADVVTGQSAGATEAVRGFVGPLPTSGQATPTTAGNPFGTTTGSAVYVG